MNDVRRRSIRDSIERVPLEVLHCFFGSRHDHHKKQRHCETDSTQRAHDLPPRQAHLHEEVEVRRPGKHHEQELGKEREEVVLGRAYSIATETLLPVMMMTVVGVTAGRVVLARRMLVTEVNDAQLLLFPRREPLHHEAVTLPLSRSSKTPSGFFFPTPSLRSLSLSLQVTATFRKRKKKTEKKEGRKIFSPSLSSFPFSLSLSLSVFCLLSSRHAMAPLSLSLSSLSLSLSSSSFDSLTCSP